MKNDAVIQAEPTPNPRTMKFIVDRKIATETFEMRSALEATRSPLATKLFGFPWLESVFVGPNFVAITKQDWVDWDVLAQPLQGLIKEHIDEGLPVLNPAEDKAESAGPGESDSPVVRRIREVIDTEIRPAVAMDGGDIVFEKYQDGRVHLIMRGACSGCPSSAYTLKVGIETRLKEAVPEIVEVVAVQ
ncbi:MAG TPA: NifU family protein [Bdellovibrionales bacterium]|nr:NifU family protein [Bdellovibrionales bacterium]